MTKSHRTPLIHLATLGREHFALDLSNERLLRLETLSLETASSEIAPLAPLMVGELTTDEHPDPMRPELFRCDTLQVANAKAPRRRTRKVLERLAAPTHQPPLWRSGPSVAYSRLVGMHPSTAILSLTKSMSIFESPRDHLLHLGFSWNETMDSLPLSLELCERLIAQPAQPVSGRKALKAILGYRPSFALVAYALPEDGYCKKVVVGLYQ